MARQLLLLLSALLLMCACGSPEGNKYAKAMEEIVLANAPGADKLVYKFTVLDMHPLPDITLDSLVRLKPSIVLPDTAAATVKVMRTHYQTTDPRSGSITSTLRQTARHVT